MYNVIKKNEKEMSPEEVFDRYRFDWLGRNCGYWYGFYGLDKPKKDGTHYESTGYARYGVPLKHFGIELDVSVERYSGGDLIHRPVDVFIADRSDIGEVVFKTEDRSSTAILICILASKFYCVDSISDNFATAYDKVYKIK